MTAQVSVHHPRPRAAAGAGLPIGLVNQVLAGVIFGLMTVQVWGPMAVALNLVATMALVALQPGLMTAHIVRRGFIFALPLLACASALWSLAPDISLRYGIQILITALMGAALAIALSPRVFIRVLMVSSLVVCAWSIVDGRTGSSADGLVLTGLTGSKNQISYLAQLLLAAAVGVLVDRQQPRLLRLVSLAALPVAAWLLLQANSATGVLTAIAGLMLFFGIWALKLFAPSARALLVTGMLAATIPTAMMAPDLIRISQNFITNSLNKDATLSGRTYLWAQADVLISERPVLGHGYKAIFMGHSAKSIGLLRWSHQTDPRGFHFHDTYREMAVDMGMAGVLAFSAVFWITGLALALRAIHAPSIGNAFLLSLFAVLAARSKPDLIVGAFSPYFALQFSLAIYAFGSRWNAQGAAQPRGPAARRWVRTGAQGQPAQRAPAR